MSTWEERMAQRTAAIRRLAEAKKTPEPAHNWEPVYVPAGAAIAVHDPDADLQWRVYDGSLIGHLVHSEYGILAPPLCGEPAAPGYWLAYGVETKGVRSTLEAYDVLICHACTGVLADTPPLA